MLTRSITVLGVGLFASAVSAQNSSYTYPECESYGVDFQSGGVYFQNISSPGNFWFVELFENCQDDTAYNLLVDPNGDEYACDNVPLLPADVPRLSNCEIDKDQMWTGDWSILVLSNNGDNGADPLAQERDFSLIVATPSTLVVTPTISATVMTTPTSSVTTTLVISSTMTVVRTTTVPAQTKIPTYTVIPPAKTTTRTWVLGTATSTTTIVHPVVSTVTDTMTCSLSTQATSDAPLTWTPSLLPSAVASSFSAAQNSSSSSTDSPAATPASQAAPLTTAGPTTAASPSSSAAPASSAPASQKLAPKPKPQPPSWHWRRVPADRAERVAARKERLAEARVNKRGIDVPVTTITDALTSDWITVTSTRTAPTTTLTLTSVQTSSTTTTSVSTLLSGTTTLRPKTITKPTPTMTSMTFTVLTTTVSVTHRPKTVLTVTTAPALSTSVCAAKGGQMVAS